MEEVDEVLWNEEIEEEEEMDNEELEKHDYETIKILLMATEAGLHNFLRKESCSNEFPIEEDNEHSTSSSSPENEGNNYNQVFQTQEQRENANYQWRVGISSDMWRDAMNGRSQR
ncbi:hypothetical protein L3X38_013185 [Prunus dulcis]|uniref:Uncharacterized protein n=1 Tax=Prunus dulcis TaxID=3755 RepID=A0AAD4ZHB6_PRUDU|nr:hypothetical protein L3X38_013185 [Prunus dulcis]